MIRPFVDDGDAVADGAQLLQLAGHHDDGHAQFPVVLVQGVQHQALGADVDAAGGFGDEQQVRRDGEGLGQADLLLVAAGELHGLLLGAGALDVQDARCSPR